MTSESKIHEVSVEEGYAHWAAQYDQEENALIVLEEQITMPLLATLPVTNVLDLGTGTGRYAIRLAMLGADVIALDQSEAMLTVARQAAITAGVPVEFLQRSLDKVLPYEPNSFDLVLAALVLCHVENLGPVAQEAYRILHPGGHLLVTDFHPAVIAAGWRTQFSTMDDTTYLLPTVHHTRDDYLAALHNAGFQIQRVQEALVREAVPDTFPAELLARDGDKPFCLVILATKPPAAKA